MEHESTDTSELAQGDDASLDFLLKRDEAAERAQQGEPEESEEEETETAEAEEAESEEETEETVEEDDDPEIDLGEIKLRKSELKAGYMKDADYRQKTAKAAEVTREAQASIDRTRQEREFFANQIAPTLEAAHRQLIGDQAILAQLAVDDPATWVRESAAFQQRAQQFQQLQQASQALAQQAKADDEAQHRVYRQEQAALLQEKLPQWKDAKVKASESEIIGKYAMELGYTPAELNELFDHRAVVILRDAAMAANARTARESAKSKQTKPEPPKVLKPGASTPKPEQGKSRTDDLLRAAKRSHNSDDAVDWLLARQAK